MMRECPYTAPSRDVLDCTSPPTSRFPLALGKFLGVRRCITQYIPPLSSACVQCTSLISFLNVDYFDDTLGFRGLWEVCTWAPTSWTSRGVQRGLALGSSCTVSERPQQVQKSDPSLVKCQLLVQTPCLSKLNPLNVQPKYGPNIDGENLRCRLR